MLFQIYYRAVFNWVLSKQNQTNYYSLLKKTTQPNNIISKHGKNHSPIAFNNN